MTLKWVMLQSGPCAPRAGVSIPARHRQLCRCPATHQRCGQAGGRQVLAWPATGVSPIWAGSFSLPAACSNFYQGKSCWYSAKDLPLFTGQGLCFVEATVRKQQFMLKEKLNKNDGLYCIWHQLAVLVRRRDRRGWLSFCLIFLKHGTV